MGACFSRKQTTDPFIHITYCQWLGDRYARLSFCMYDEFGHSCDREKMFFQSEVARGLLSSYKYRLRFISKQQLPVLVGVNTLINPDNGALLDALLNKWPRQN